ncbi:MBOAT family O-acyltransferase [Neolewinella antarctica]|uniref:Alginate O-acetyltransferase complex protein AlgI n=1 Tax=Neolewinella antarctica TaxID=442734 RepID=A0ABX0XCJ8_9BACT|nr:MBOAT family O-acyltransferase [Neolewinella antarctica]NJC26932.1 alginate O-acetyltransferase complex protein AlgI [Neolewinella antarctica]
MVFSSIIFLFYFLPVFLVVYTLAPERWKNAVILTFSVFFYAWGAPVFVFVLLASTIIDFYLVRSLHRAATNRGRKVRLLLSLSLNLGLLAYFKYANFFVENLNAALLSAGVDAVGWTAVALPIGISFYTFQTLTYSIDVYRRQLEPLDRLADYLLFIMSFPQMIAGPIVRFREVAAQLRERQSTYEDKLLGFHRFCLGLAKKVFIANVLGAKADEIYALDFTTLDAPTAWLGAVAYAGQIYFDFAGYSDMAIGLGRMMGFRFPENFNSPYVATSISDFWRRWHITLGRWMRDYLYIPLGGNRVGSRFRLYFNLWVVFLLSGLWHGASWNFVIWGAFHGFFLVLDRLFLLRWLGKVGRLPAVIFTCFVVIIGWVFFRLETLGEATEYLSAMFRWDFALPVASPKLWLTLAVSLLASWGVLSAPGRWVEARLYPTAVSSTGTAVVYLTLGLLVYLLSAAVITSQGFNPFIYFRF